ncbi:rod shape-determining protein [Patescibacteria group bacterium]|nr:rod shape-determining protein [Patescibacteria group bacterium]
MNFKSFNDKELYIDIGSANTIIYSDNQEIFNEPTCIVYHKDSDSVVAVGEKALMLLGKTPSSIEIGFPVQHGSISNTKYFELFLLAVLNKVTPKNRFRRMIFGLDGKFSIMSSLSPAKKRLLQTLLRKIGFSKIKLVDSSYAAALSICNGDKAQLNNFCVIDIGAQKTEIAVFSMDELVRSKSFKWGGIKLTEALQKIVRSQYQCVVGWHLAEEAKKQVGTLGADKNKFALHGKDLVSQASKTIVFSSDDVRVEFNRLFEELLDDIQSFISTLPSEIAVSILDRGMFMTGGGSMLSGIDSAIRKRLKCDVFISSNPKRDVINGLRL